MSNLEGPFKYGVYNQDYGSQQLTPAQIKENQESRWAADAEFERERATKARYTADESRLAEMSNPNNTWSWNMGGKNRRRRSRKNKRTKKRINKRRSTRRRH